MKRYFRKTLFASLFFLSQLLSWGQGYLGNNVDDSTRQQEEALGRRLFLMLDLLRQDEALYQKIMDDGRLLAIQSAYKQRLKKAIKSSTTAAMARLVSLKPEEIAGAGVALSHILPPSFISTTRSLPCYYGYSELRAENFIQQIWSDMAAGMNRIIDVYIAGQRPHYASIDSVSYDVTSQHYVKKVRTVLSSIASLSDKSSFFQQPMMLAVQILLLNKRNEAIRYEPLEQGLNKLSAARVSSLPWDNYTFSAILVPGFGPDKPGVRIDHRSVQRCRMAAGILKEGRAPFLILSGGHVYPAGTPFSEAVEMRSYLIDSLGIDPSFIIIEPHARHTTTNVRNAARIIYRFKMPDNKPILVVSDENQINMFETLAQRCRKELGYVPYEREEKISINQVKFYPTKRAFQININDPLDP